ncbi:MAG: nucleotide sugar dehydrogenase [Coriobacteriales bacterium]|jgi:UDPglucose 6-dehydrogenase|nr:nucleotide sugar dehydrogenase [Coriobacteriales bacterium]
MNIAVAGMGYVGLSVACLLASHNTVWALDVDAKRVALVNQGRAPFADPDIEAFLSAKAATIHATGDAALAYRDADYIIIATPTDYDDTRAAFDTSSIEQALALASDINPRACFVIKSTVPIGYTDRLAAANPGLDILFSPEFLREGHALYDNLHPSRVIVGLPTGREDLREAAQGFASLLAQGAGSSETGAAEAAPALFPQLILGAGEAEAIKLFSNTYLALRVAFFNELDAFAETRGLDSAKIIRGVGLDPRVGQHYNNPSFGYGGYCLPKDSRQLLTSFDGIPQSLIGATVEANRKRMEFIAERVLAQGGAGALIGVYRLVMKEGSDNFRQSSILEVMRLLKDRGVELLIYEPLLAEPDFEGSEVTSDLADFKARSTLIISNRYSDDLADVCEKLYTRDQQRGD